MRFTKTYETRFKPYLADPSCIPLRNTQLHMLHDLILAGVQLAHVA